MPFLPLARWRERGTGGEGGKSTGSRRLCPRFFANPTTAWLPFSRWREQGAGGMRVEQHWFAQGLPPVCHQ
jgi:hypothetical protein